MFDHLHSSRFVMKRHEWMRKEIHTVLDCQVSLQLAISSFTFSQNKDSLIQQYNIPKYPTKEMIGVHSLTEEVTCTYQRKDLAYALQN